MDKDQKPLRKKYLEAMVPPFVAVLRRWRPILAGIHELATADGVNPLTVDDRALAADALPIEVLSLAFEYMNTRLNRYMCMPIHRDLLIGTIVHGYICMCL